MPGSKTNGLRQRSEAPRHRHPSLLSKHPNSSRTSCHPYLLSLHQFHHLRLHLYTKILTNSQKTTICLPSPTEICQGYPFLPNIIANVKLRSSLGTPNIDMPLNQISQCPVRGARVPRRSKLSNSKRFMSILLTLPSSKGRNSDNVLACESDSYDFTHMR